MSACQDDVLLWPCGTWCYRFDLEEMLSWHSDDYQVLPMGSVSWNSIAHADELEHVQTARLEGYGYLSAGMGEPRPLQVLKSAAGYYLGTLTEEGAPYTRESEEYWTSREAAESAKSSGHWVQRMSL